MAVLSCWGRGERAAICPADPFHRPSSQCYPSCLLLDLSLTSGALPPRQCSQGIEPRFQACTGFFLLPVDGAFLAQVPVDNSCDTFHQL